MAARLRAALVVGADGGQSWVRNQCDIGIDYRSYGQRGVVTNFECEKPHHGIAYQWFTGHRRDRGPVAVAGAARVAGLVGAGARWRKP